MNLLYITFGDNLGIHLQAAFCVCSFLAKENGDIQSINIITDKPAFYIHLAPKVNVIPVSQQQLADWQGEHRFFWRIKIKAIEKICALYPNSPVVYLDADTFLFGSIDRLSATLLGGKALMHRNEAVLSTGKSSTEKKMWKQIKNEVYEGFDMRPTDCMWNAGIVATPNNRQNEESRLALAICDQMCAQGVTRRLIEQYSLSLSLDRLYGLGEAQTEIAHYWTAKGTWDQRIAAFFIEAHFAQWPLETVVEKVRHFDVGKLPIDQRNRSTNGKLKKWVDKWYPSENLAFIKQP